MLCLGFNGIRCFFEMILFLFIKICVCKFFFIIVLFWILLLFGFFLLCFFIVSLIFWMVLIIVFNFFGFRDVWWLGLGIFWFKVKCFLIIVVLSVIVVIGILMLRVWLE